MMMQALSRAGLVIGDELLPPGPSNPDGHFEDRRLVRWHDDVLTHNGGCWHSPPDKPIVVPAALEQRLDDALAPYLEQANPWGFKDPRTCLMLPFWVDRLPGCVQVFTYREPAACVHSLLTRQAQLLTYHPVRHAEDLFFWHDPNKALALWMTYNNAMLAAVKSDPEVSLLVSYESLLTGFPLVSTVNERFALKLNQDADSGIRTSRAQKSAAQLPAGINDELIDEAMALLAELDEFAESDMPVPRVRPTQSKSSRCDAQQTQHYVSKLALSVSTKDCASSDAQAAVAPTVEQFDEALVLQAELRSDDCQFNIAVGRDLSKMGDTTRATVCFQRAHAAAPRNYVPVMYLGLIARREQHDEVALQHFLAAIERNADSAGLYCYLCQAHRQLGDNDAALQACTAGLDRDAQHTDLLQQQIELLLADRRFDEAMRAVRHALERFPNLHQFAMLYYYLLTARSGQSVEPALPWFYQAVHLKMQAIDGYGDALELAIASLESCEQQHALRLAVNRELSRIHEAADNAPSAAA